MDLSNATWRKSSHSADNSGDCVELAGIWRKSSYSASTGGNCVEASEAWRKASHSGDNGGNCVELAGRGDRLVAVRDSKDPDGPVLLMEPSTLRAAVRAAMSQTV